MVPLCPTCPLGSNSVSFVPEGAASNPIRVNRRTSRAENIDPPSNPMQQLFGVETFDDDGLPFAAPFRKSELVTTNLQAGMKK